MFGERGLFQGASMSISPPIVLIGIDVSSYKSEHFESIRRMDFLKDSDIHIINIVQEYVTGYDLMQDAQIFFQEDKLKIQHSVLAKLKEISKEILPSNLSGKIFYHCLFGFDPKRMLVSAASEFGAQLIILFNRKNLPLFDESTCYFCGLHSSSDVLILRESSHDQFKGRLNVTCALKIDEDSLTSFNLKRYSFLSRSNIHLVHISPQSHFSSFFNVFNSIFKEERELVIREAVLNKLEKNRTRFLPDDFQGEYHHNCLFSNHVKHSFCEFSNTKDSDLMVIPQKHKAFGTFFHYQLNHFQRNILILRSSV
jgi:hypothetical protein